MAEATPRYAELLSRAWPVIVANAAAPLLGLVDTAVIGNTGAVADLGAIALGALVFNFLYWGFGFLRMGTTGFTAQADGRDDSAEVRVVLARALVLALACGLLLVALQWPIIGAALGLLDGSAAVETSAATYLGIRIWGAPAALATFAMMGTLIGLGLTRQLLAVQLFLNGLNIVLDLWLAGVLGWGVAGIATGTVIAEWAAAGLSAAILWRVLRRRHVDDEPFLPIARLRSRSAAVALLGANRDLMLRTLLMLLCFAWFTNAGARFGDVVLAANHILLQFISFSAYFLDGFAFVAEGEVGRAIGRRRRALLDAVVRRSTELAAITACCLAALLLVFADAGIAVLTDLPAVRSQAAAFVPFAAAYIAVSFAAFQLDGIFIGATRHADMRNASALSAAGFALLALLLAGAYGNLGLWAAFIAYVLLRALALLLRYPALRAAIPDA